MMATAFLGYVLPWGQMSFWGATVITNLVGAVPVVGGDILTWLWGGFSIGNAALTRFFALHFALPFVIAGVTGVHIVLVQHFSSNNPLGVHFMMDYIPFTPYYLAKDVWGFVLFGLAYAFFVFFAPNLMGHPDNYILANPMVTPAHIVPEWYFLPFYAVLRSIPDKFGGVLAMGAAIAVLFVLPWTSRAELRSMQFRPVSKLVFWLWAANFVYLGILGGLPADKKFAGTLVNSVVFYFAYLLVLQPVIDLVENHLFRRAGASNTSL
jgi:ubiquinol-cytochrome c reductase cytochrome b subunit